MIFCEVWIHNLLITTITEACRHDMFCDVFPQIKFFTNSPQYKTAIFAKFILAVPFKINKTNEVCHIEM